MEKMNDLKELLRHDVHMLYEMEKQIIEGMPAMIAMAHHPELRMALEEHLRVTERQRDRIDQVRLMIGADEDSVKKYSGFFANLMGGSTTCKGMQGIIEDGGKIMSEDLGPDVLDAAIVAGSQKIEHYEIACYGTARTYAQQLGLTEVAALLQQTLDEEYQADQILTRVAEMGINQEAEMDVHTAHRHN